MKNTFNELDTAILTLTKRGLWISSSTISPDTMGMFIVLYPARICILSSAQHAFHLGRAKPHDTHGPRSTKMFTMSTFPFPIISFGRRAHNRSRGMFIKRLARATEPR